MARGIQMPSHTSEQSQEREGGKAIKANWRGQSEMSKLAVIRRDRPGEARRRGNAAVKAFTVVPFKRRDKLLKCSFRQ